MEAVSEREREREASRVEGGEEGRERGRKGGEKVEAHQLTGWVDSFRSISHSSSVTSSSMFHKRVSPGSMPCESNKDRSHCNKIASTRLVSFAKLWRRRGSGGTNEIHRRSLGG